MMYNSYLGVETSVDDRVVTDAGLGEDCRHSGESRTNVGIEEGDEESKDGVGRPSHEEGEDHDSHHEGDSRLGLVHAATHRRVACLKQRQGSLRESLSQAATLSE